MIITHGADPNQAALTLDDGPSPVNTLPLLHVLAAHKAKATFFMIGRWVEKFPDIARQVRDEGHEIGNHTMSHPPVEYGDEEVLECDNSFRDAGIVPGNIFRPPYGNTANNKSHKWGFDDVLWSQLSGDWAATSTEEIVSKINLDTDKGEIVLLHDGCPDNPKADRSHTVEAVEIILQKYSHKSFVTVSQLTLG